MFVLIALQNSEYVVIVRKNVLLCAIWNTNGFLVKIHNLHILEDELICVVWLDYKLSMSMYGIIWWSKHGCSQRKASKY